MEGLLKFKSIFIVGLISLISFSIYHFRGALKPVALGPKVENFVLFDLEQKAFRLHEIKEAPAVILFTYEVGCPIAEQQLSYLKQLKVDYSDVKIYLLVSSSNINKNDLKKEIKRFNINFPILLDEAQTIAKLLNIKRTAEAFLIETNDFHITYRGAVSDRFNYGSQRDDSTNFLRNSLEKLIKFKSYEYSYNEPKGCLINIKKPKQISYSADIVPILKNNCLSCHHTKGRGPWSMDSYDKIVSWSKMIREVVLTKRMPLRFINGGDYEFKDKGIHGLSPIEESKLLTWISEGVKKDFKVIDPLNSVHNDKLKVYDSWPWGKPDLVVTLKQDIAVPANGWYDWQFRYLKLNQYLKEDKWLKAVYIKPGNARATHHASVWAQIKDKDKQSQGAAYIKKKSWKENSTIQKLISNKQFSWASDLGQLITKDVDSLVDNSRVGILIGNTTKDPFDLIGSYNSGHNHPPYPEGTVRFLPQDSILRFIMHYKTIGRDIRTRPKVGLYFHKKKIKDKLLVFKFIQGNFFTIPAGKKLKHHFYHVLEKGIKLYASSSHLHYRGRSQKLIAHFPSGKVKTIYNEPNYQYDGNAWGYYYKKPITLPKGTLIESISHIDNTQFNPFNPDPNKDQQFDFQLNKEMIWATITYTDL